MLVEDESIHNRRLDIYMNAVSKRKERKSKRKEKEKERSKRIILAVGRRSSKFRLIAPSTAPARFYSEDAFRCPNIAAVNIPTGISIHRPSDIIVSLIFYVGWRSASS